MALGRIRAVRTAGSKLVFIDLACDDASLQMVVQLDQLKDVTPRQFKDATRVIRKGDWYLVTGWPHRTERGEPSVLATELPTMLSPSLHQIPETLEDPETRARSRHVDMLVNPASIQPLLVRHHITHRLREYFNENHFVEVSTPIITAGAGGAVARPFETEATELQGQTLNLRIAPELWLKRLVVGGMRRVYEIGPAFRNEGVDATHNPEFTICEFYEAFATLDNLMFRTEYLLGELHSHINACGQPFPYGPESPATLSGVPNLDLNLKGPYPRLEFLPTLQNQIRPHRLPDLTSPTALDDLLTLFQTLNRPLPANPTLPRLLDTLSATYLEPLCQSPTFLIHPPALLSPLAKTLTCPTTGQAIAARAELLIAGREYANMYEEENSPFAQRAKLEQQLAFRAVDREGDGRLQVDERYLEALEWGLPPTGGWGCGVDRLVMLFSGREKLADCLAFGSLRHVAGGGGAGEK